MFNRQKNILNSKDIQDKINELHNFYMPVNLNSEYYQSKVIATNKLDFILKSCDRHSLQISDFENLLVCALTIVYYFGMRLKLSRLTSKYWHWCGKRRFHKAEKVFQKTMDLLLPERSEMTIKITLDFFTEVALWPFESFVVQILELVLYFNRGKTGLFNIMLTDIHYVMFSDVKSARHRMRVFYELLNSSNWVIDNHKLLLPFVTRLLHFFAQSINNKISAYKYLRKGFEVCLRRIFERVRNEHRLMIITTMLNWFSMANMKRDDFLEFSALLYHAADFFIVGRYPDSFGQGLIEHVMSHYVGSPDNIYSLVGSRLLQKFLDRQKNMCFLHTPMIFYEFSQVKFAVGVYSASDKSFIRRNREKLHFYLIRAIKLHSDNIVNLRHIYSIICTIVLEVPCGLTAAAAACMLMVIQDIALTAEKISPYNRYWLHAVVVSVMSLICWVHKSSVLYTYVNLIISRRATEAPQLNPPLMHNYQIGRHHVTWNKPTLFFEDWELRYALWKHFQDVQPCLQKNMSGTLPNRMKIPLMDVTK